MYVSVRVDVEEVYDELSTFEKKQVAEWLYDEGIVAIKPNEGNKNTTLLEDEFIEKMAKIIESYVRLTNEQIDAIEQIFNQL